MSEIAMPKPAGLPEGGASPAFLVKEKGKQV